MCRDLSGATKLQVASFSVQQRLAARFVFPVEDGLLCRDSRVNLFSHQTELVKSEKAPPEAGLNQLPLEDEFPQVYYSWSYFEPGWQQQFFFYYYYHLFIYFYIRHTKPIKGCFYPGADSDLKMYKVHFNPPFSILI